MAPGGLTRATPSELRLPSGRRSLSREQVEENQRWRLMVATAQLFAERGFEGMKSREVAARASVSRATFYKYFDNVDDCLLASYEMAAECLCDVVAPVCQETSKRGERLEQAVERTLEFLAAEPVVARLIGAEAPAGVRSIAPARERFISRLAAMLRGDRKSQGDSAAEPAPPVEPLIDSALALACQRSEDDLRGLAPELAELLSARLRPDQDSNLGPTP